MVIDTQRTIIFVNSAAQTLFKTSFNATDKQSLDQFANISEQALQTLTQAINKDATFTQRKAVWALDCGEHITIDYTVTPLHGSTNTIIEIHPLDRVLRISREESLHTSQQATRHLVRGLAHEIKNPLGGIRGAAQLLQSELALLATPNQYGEYTRVIIDETDRLSNLVDQLLGPKEQPSFDWVNLHELLERVALLASAQSQHHITIERDYDPSIPDCLGDAERLIQALLNIVQNAIQSLTEHATDNAHIILSTRIERQLTINGTRYPLACSVAIIDNGPGINDDIIDTIFYPMITTRAEGTGLGLAIAQHIAHQHQGVIDCTSQAGKTTFTLMLPLETQ